MYQWYFLKFVYALLFVKIDLVQAEAVVKDEVGQGMVKVRSQAHNAMVLIRIRQLLEQNVGLLQGSCQHHTLLVVHIVIWKGNQWFSGSIININSE